MYQFTISQILGLLIFGGCIGGFIVNAIWWREHKRTIAAWEADECQCGNCDLGEDDKLPSGNDLLQEDQDK